MNSNVTVPTKIEEITAEWVSQILGTKISKDDFNLQTNVQSGSGFLSKMSRVQCKSDLNGKLFTLIVKLLPEDETMKSLVISEEFDRTEVEFYQKVMPELIKMLPELENYLCHSYYGTIQPENIQLGLEYSSVLVLEDLKPLGYYTINFAGKVTFEQMQEIVQFLAKFHFAGMALEKIKGQPLNKTYDFLQGADISKSSMFYEMAKTGFVEVQRILKDAGSSQELIDSINKLAPHSDRIISKVQAAGQSFACLIHGDLWVNNCLFNADPKMHTKVIDWQLLGYKDPNYDLAVTIISSLSVDQLEEGKVFELLKMYYDTFTQECEAAGQNNLITRDFETFKEFFYSWGMAYTLLWFLMSSDPFAEDFPKLVKIYDILSKQMNVPAFLLKQLEDQ